MRFHDSMPCENDLWLVEGNKKINSADVFDEKKWQHSHVVFLVLLPFPIPLTHSYKYLKSIIKIGCDGISRK